MKTTIVMMSHDVRTLIMGIPKGTHPLGVQSNCACRKSCTTFYTKPLTLNRKPSPDNCGILEDLLIGARLTPSTEGVGICSPTIMPSLALQQLAPSFSPSSRVDFEDVCVGLYMGGFLTLGVPFWGSPELIRVTV